MFDFLAHSAFGFWIVAFIIIAVDSTLFLVSDQFTFTFTERLNVRLRIAENPYLLRHKEPVVTLFAHLATPFFISSMDVPSHDTWTTKRLLLRQKRAASHSKQLTNLALLSLVLVCLVGPIASLQYGIERAIIMIAPALYVSAFFGLAIIWLKRTIFGFDNRALTHICFELTLCPILMVNIFKRIAVRQTRLCADDLIEHFTRDHAETMRRLKQHLEATAQ